MEEHSGIGPTRNLRVRIVLLVVWGESSAVKTHLTIEELLYRCQPLLGIHTDANILSVLVLLDGKDDRRNVEIAKESGNTMRCRQVGHKPRSLVFLLKAPGGGAAVDKARQVSAGDLADEVCKIKAELDVLWPGVVYVFEDSLPGFRY